MSASTILAELWSNNVLVRLAPDGENLTVPAGRLTPEQRALVLAHKAELIAFLVEARATTAALIDSAMRVCDQSGDGAVARDDMRKQCLGLPVHLRADLLDHFHACHLGHRPSDNNSSSRNDGAP